VNTKLFSRRSLWWLSLSVAVLGCDVGNESTSDSAAPHRASKTGAVGSSTRRAGISGREISREVAPVLIRLGESSQTAILPLATGGWISPSTTNDIIGEFDALENLVRPIARRGGGPGEFRSVVDLVLDSSRRRIALIDIGLNRISILPLDSTRDSTIALNLPQMSIRGWFSGDSTLAALSVGTRGAELRMLSLTGKLLGDPWNPLTWRDSESRPASAARLAELVAYHITGDRLLVVADGASGHIACFSLVEWPPAKVISPQCAWRADGPDALSEAQVAARLREYEEGMVALRQGSPRVTESMIAQLKAAFEESQRSSLPSKFFAGPSLQSLMNGDLIVGLQDYSDRSTVGSEVVRIDKRGQMRRVARTAASIKRLHVFGDSLAVLGRHPDVGVVGWRIAATDSALVLLVPEARE